jgi:hypothetical protein
MPLAFREKCVLRRAIGSRIVIARFDTDQMMVTLGR